MLSLRKTLLIVPVLVLVSTAIATAYAARHAAAAANARIEERQAAIARTLRGPPTFPLTLPVLTQMKNLTGAEFTIGSVSTHAGAFERRDYFESKIELAEPHPNAGATVLVQYPESVRRAEVNDAVRPVLALGIGAGLLGTVLTLAVSAWLVRRIRAIEAGTRAIAAGRFEPMPISGTNDELGELVASVNEMARKLAANVETQKQTERLRVLGQVSGGLAHQLRNAATGAKLALQLDDAESLPVAERQLARMESILKQFLELGQHEPNRFASMDLSEVVRKAVTLVEPRARHQCVDIQYEEVYSSVQRLDAEQFGHLLENLLLNAIDAAGPGGRVLVRVLPDAVEVIDSGPGVSAEAKLFEPFSTTKPGGIGLGLVVAKQVAEAHGATITWLRRDGMTVFQVRFA